MPIEGLKLTCSTYLSCHRLLIYILTSAFRRWRLQSWSQSFVVSTCIVQHAMSERRYHQITSKMWTLNNICGFVLAANPLHLEPPLPVLPSPTVELYISFATCRYSFCVHEAKTVKCFRQRLTFCLSVCLSVCFSVSLSVSTFKKLWTYFHEIFDGVGFGTKLDFSEWCGSASGNFTRTLHRCHNTLSAFARRCDPVLRRRRYNVIVRWMVIDRQISYACTTTRVKGMTRISELSASFALVIVRYARHIVGSYSCWEATFLWT